MVLVYIIIAGKEELKDPIKEHAKMHELGIAHKHDKWWRLNLIWLKKNFLKFLMLLIKSIRIGEKETSNTAFI